MAAARVASGLAVLMRLNVGLSYPKRTGVEWWNATVPPIQPKLLYPTTARAGQPGGHKISHSGDHLLTHIRTAQGASSTERRSHARISSGRLQGPSFSEKK
jgi:hypothetical protein